MSVTAAARQRQKEAKRTRGLTHAEVQRIFDLRAQGATLRHIVSSLNLRMLIVELVLSGKYRVQDTRPAAYSEAWAKTFGVQVMRGRVEGIEGPLQLGTDASFSNRLASFGYVNTAGDWAVYALEMDHDKVSVTSLELAAIAAGLESMDRPVRISTDSLYSVQHVGAWRSGKDYSLPCEPALSPVLDRLREGLHAKRWPKLKIAYVKGHSGHLLNEAADSISKLGVRSLLRCELDSGEAQQRAQSLVQSFLTSVREQSLVSTSA